MSHGVNTPQPLTQQVWEAVPRIKRDGHFITASQCQTEGYSLYRANTLMLMELTGLGYEEAKELAKSHPGKAVSEVMAEHYNPEAFQDLTASFAAVGKVYGEAFGGLVKAFEAFTEGFTQGLRQMRDAADKSSQDDFAVTA